MTHAPDTPLFATARRPDAPHGKSHCRTGSPRTAFAGGRRSICATRTSTALITSDKILTLSDKLNDRRPAIADLMEWCSGWPSVCADPVLAEHGRASRECRRGGRGDDRRRSADACPGGRVTPGASVAEADMSSGPFRWACRCVARATRQRCWTGTVDGLSESVNELSVKVNAAPSNHRYPSRR